MIIYLEDYNLNNFKQKKAFGARNIQLKTFDQAVSTENRIKIMWNTKTINWEKSGKMSDCLLSSTDMRAKYIHKSLICDWYQQNS